MHYKGFIIESQSINECIWHSKTGSMSIVGTRTVYAVRSSVSSVVFAIKHSAELARTAIDKNAYRWLKN
jgi:hypothetical protein